MLHTSAPQEKKFDVGGQAVMEGVMMLAERHRRHRPPS